MGTPLRKSCCEIRAWPRNQHQTILVPLSVLQEHGVLGTGGKAVACMETWDACRFEELNKLDPIWEQIASRSHKVILHGVQLSAYQSRSDQVNGHCADCSHSHAASCTYHSRRKDSFVRTPRKFSRKAFCPFNSREVTASVH